MFLLKNINFSKVFLGIISIAYIVNVISNYAFVEFLSLQPKSVLEQLNLWKIITFPFAINTIDSFILFAFSFHFFSEKLEKIIGTIRYSIWLLILNLILGCVVTLLFWNSTFNFAGLDSISFFVLSLYMMLKPKSSINIAKSRIYVMPSVLLFLMIWISTKIFIHGLNDVPMAINTLTSFIFGITSSLLIYFQIKIYTDKRDDKEHIEIPNNNDSDLNNLEYLTTIKEKNASYLYNTENLTHESVNDNYDYSYHGISNDPQVNEERLNYILDKISDMGQASLSVSEKKFLYFYSKQL